MLWRSPLCTRRPLHLNPTTSILSSSPAYARRSIVIHARLVLDRSNTQTFDSLLASLNPPKDQLQPGFQPQKQENKHFFEEELIRSKYYNNPNSRKMRSTVSVLTTPTVDTAGTSIVLSFDDKRYLFGNVHEGLQRVCIQNGVRLMKLNTVFLTGKTEWRTTGGLMGFILTIADVISGAAESAKLDISKAQQKFEERLRKALTEEQREALIQNRKEPKDKLQDIETPRLNIYGGENVMQLLATARRFIFRKGMPLDVHELAETISNAEPTWKDHNIRVWAMPLQPLQGNADIHSRSPETQSRDHTLNAGSSTLHKASDEIQNHKQELKAVIADMFDSDWKRDALFETPLADVKQPAAMFVRNPETRSFEAYQGPVPESGDDVSGIKVWIRRPWPSARVPELPDTQPSPISMSYIIKNYPRRGKFNPVAAKALGLDPGIAYRKLAAGESVQNKEGKTITPDQVTAPLQEAKGFATIEIPGIEYISSLATAFAFNDPEIMHGVEAIFWILGPGVAEHESFQAMIKEHANRKHVISSPDICANHLTIDSAAAAQLTHRIIDKERFSIPLHDNSARPLPHGLPDCIIAQRGVSMTVQSDQKISWTTEPQLLDTLGVIESIPQQVRILGEKATKFVQSESFQKEYRAQVLPSENAEIITLGTGSAAPSKQRNVSATLLRVPGVGSYLLDAGENTIGQLSRIYSAEELRDVLRDLKLIWISHMHADHHLGITSIIKAWHEAVYGTSSSHQPFASRLLDRMSNPARLLTESQKLCIVSEDAMLHWLKEYSQIEDIGYDKVVPLLIRPTEVHENGRIINFANLELYGQPIGFHVSNYKMRSALQQATGLSDLHAVHVAHCSHARAVALTWSNGLKISYSGDCRPSANFAAIGKGSTVLIHEATFDDTLQGDALAKKHSTTREAIGVGIKMKAKRIILTHFSQRYSKLPEMDNVVARPIAFEDAKPNERRDTSQSQSGEQSFENEEEHEQPLIMEGVETSFQQKVGASTEIPRTTKQMSISDVWPPVQEPEQTDSEVIENIKIGVAFDLMKVKIKDIMVMGEFSEAFQKLYADPEIQQAEKASRKAEAEAQRQQLEAKKKAKQESLRLTQKQKSAELKRKASQSSDLNGDAGLGSQRHSPREMA